MGQAYRNDTASHTPKIGDIVIYLDPDKSNGHQEQPAVVTCVHGPSCVNLKVLFDCKDPEDRTSVLIGERPQLQAYFR